MKEFFKNHPILVNVIAILAAGVILCWLGLVFLDIWTDHSDERQVPNVRGLSYTDAEGVLRLADLNVEISDSVYDTGRPGTVIEQSPHLGAKVKPGRTVYLTIVAFSPKTVTIPDISNVSLRQAQSIFEGLGIKNLRVVEVESEYEGLLLNAKFNGLPLSAGAQVPVNAQITLEVGKGLSMSELDSLSLSEDSTLESPALDEVDLD
ncbi:MAG: PASTA domain-containing protein [Bacteroidales bacterium]|nr:PASTA domain-containing protein [Bacteroidales bacterium]